MAVKKKECKTCIEEGITTGRPAPHPGPRCSSHHRERKRATSEGAWAKRIEETYGISAEEYFLIIEHQGGVCAICRTARGVVKRLAVDHSHSTGQPRGAICGSCNALLGRGRDDPEFFRRAADYLEDPPAVHVIGERVAPIFGTDAEKYRGGKPRKKRYTKRRSK